MKYWQPYDVNILVVYRNGDEKELEVVVEAVSKQDAFAWAEFQTMELDDKIELVEFVRVMPVFPF